MRDTYPVFAEEQRTPIVSKRPAKVANESQMGLQFEHSIADTIQQIAAQPTVQAVFQGIRNPKWFERRMGDQLTSAQRAKSWPSLPSTSSETCSYDR